MERGLDRRLVEDNWGRYTGDYIDLQGEQKWYAPEFQRKDLSLLDVLLKIRDYMKKPGHAPWHRVHFRMTSERDFNLEVKYPVPA